MSNRFDYVETYQPGDTIVFTWQASTPPDSPPQFAVFDQSSTVVASITAQQSDGLSFYALFTMPASGPSHYVAQFTAMATLAGSTYDHVIRDSFRVRNVTPTG